MRLIVDSAAAVAVCLGSSETEIERELRNLALLILGMKIILHTFKTLVETFHGTSLPPKIIRQFSNAV